MAAESRPESWLMIFFLIERLHIAEDGHRRATRGPTRQGGAPRGVRRAPTLVGRVWPPGELLALSIFYYSEIVFREVSGLLELCRIGL